MKTSNITVMLEELKRLHSELETLDEEYKGRTQGIIYNGKRALLQNRIEKQRADIDSIIIPGAIAQWEISIETPRGLVVKYLAYPGHYDRTDILRILEAQRVLNDLTELRIIDIHKLGIIRLGQLHDFNGFT